MLHLVLPVLLAAPLSQGVDRPRDSAGTRPTAVVAAPAPRGADESSSGSEPAGNPVPEPTTLLLVGTGLVGIAWGSRRLRRLRAEAHGSA